MGFLSRAAAVVRGVFHRPCQTTVIDLEAEAESFRRAVRRARTHQTANTLLAVLIAIGAVVAVLDHGEFIDLGQLAVVLIVVGFLACIVLAAVETRNEHRDSA